MRAPGYDKIWSKRKTQRRFQGLEKVEDLIRQRGKTGSGKSCVSVPETTLGELNTQHFIQSLFGSLQSHQTLGKVDSEDGSSVEHFIQQEQNQNHSTKSVQEGHLGHCLCFWMRQPTVAKIRLLVPWIPEVPAAAFTAHLGCHLLGQLPALLPGRVHATARSRAHASVQRKQRQ